MDVREQVAAVRWVGLVLWDEPGGRARVWESLRRECARRAASRGHLLADGSPESRSVLYMRWADSGTGEPMEIEASQDQASCVKMRLVAWAEPKK